MTQCMVLLLACTGALRTTDYQGYALTNTKNPTLDMAALRLSVVAGSGQCSYAYIGQHHNQSDSTCQLAGYSCKLILCSHSLTLHHDLAFMQYPFDGCVTPLMVPGTILSQLGMCRKGQTYIEIQRTLRDFGDLQSHDRSYDLRTTATVKACEKVGVKFHTTSRPCTHG